MDIEKLYCDNYTKLFYYAKSLCGSDESAEELLQQAWLNLIVRKDKASIKYPISYVGSTIKNLYLNSVRSKINQPELKKVYDDSLFSVDCAGENFLDSIKEYQSLMDRMNELPKKQKDACYYRLFLGMSFVDIAELLGQPYDTVKANFRHGFLKLNK